MKTTRVVVAGIVMAAAIGAVIYGQRPAKQSAEGTGLPLASVQVPDLSPDEERGEATFNTYCATCHGKDAAGQDGVAPPLVHQIYEPGHHGDQAFFLAAQQGAHAHHWPFGDMPPVEGITEHEIADVVAYVRALQRANGID